MVDVAPALVARDKPAKAVDSCERPLDDPSVSAQLLATFDTASCAARSNPATMAGLAAPSMGVGLVGVELVRPAVWPACLAADRRDAVEQLLERHAVVGVGAGEDEGERNAVPIGDEMAFRAEPAATGWVRPCLVTPLFAAREALARHARPQSIRSAARRRRSSSQYSASHTPASRQSRKPRQHVMPEPHPILSGSISHWMPVRSTNRIPVSATRSGTRSLPPRGRSREAGSRGSMIDQRASEKGRSHASS